MTSPRAMAALSLALGITSIACAAPEPPHDDRIRAATEVLEVPWHDGGSWSLEVHGIGSDGRQALRFWGVTHHWVTEILGDRAVVEVEFHPLWDVNLGSISCQAQLRFQLRPWRLTEVLLRDGTGEQRFEAHEGAEEPPASPCLLFAPRHPRVPSRDAVASHAMQAVTVDGDDVLFFLSGIRRHGPRVETRLLRWRRGDPWWRELATLGRKGMPPPRGRPPIALREDALMLERARLVAVDGAAVRPPAWSPSPWAREGHAAWVVDPAGFAPNGLLDPADEPTPVPR